MNLLYRLVFSSLLLLPLWGQSYVLNNANELLVPKSVEFVNELSSELFAKTGFSLYVVAVDKIDGEGKAGRLALKQKILSSLSNPYGVLFFIKSHKKIDIVLNPNLDKVDTGEIITQYMVPILIQEKELNPKVISAAILNGYAKLADDIAKTYDVGLEKNIIVDTSGVKDFIHYSIYVMLGIMFGLIFLIYLFRKKR